MAYASQQLRSYEKNFLIYDLEFAPVIYALKLWRHYLYEAKFETFTNRKNLKYMSMQPNLNMRQRVGVAKG